MPTTLSAPTFMPVSAFTVRIRPRAIHGATAVLLPYDADGHIDWEGFGRHLAATAASGLEPALNMDTGFGPQLSPDQRRQVLALARTIVGRERPLIAGIFAGAATGDVGDPLASYRASLADVLDVGATPIVFQSPWLTARRGADLADAYRAILAGAERALAFELGTMFAPFGRIYDLDDYARVMDLANVVGAKHSSLDRRLELMRLELRDCRRPDFRVYTGNDLAIDLVQYGSDYLLGLSTCDPEAFALRDQWWAEGDARFFQLNDALQALGAVAFRPPVPAYKHSAAIYLGLAGRLPAAHVHPGCPRRPEWEAEILRPLLAQVEAAKRQEAAPAAAG
jgi:dihydrodipicolinate synthase/N-acetylneuraminate lyase